MDRGGFRRRITLSGVSASVAGDDNDDDEDNNFSLFVKEKREGKRFRWMRLYFQSAPLDSSSGE